MPLFAESNKCGKEAQCPRCRATLANPQADRCRECGQPLAGSSADSKASVASASAAPSEEAVSAGSTLATPEDFNPPPPRKTSSSLDKVVSLVLRIRKSHGAGWDAASPSSTGGGETKPAAREPDDGQKLLAGEIVGAYRLVMPVGEGSFGFVWKGTHLKTSQDVAIKFLSKQREHGHPSYRNRFLREARAATRVQHPNLVAVLDSGTHKDRLYMVQEYVSGESLGEILRRDGKFPEELALKVAQSMGEALRAAHLAGIVHRDIKPDNIILAADGSLKLIDLGLVKEQGRPEESNQTAPETALGTPRYLAPEQAHDARMADARSDLYGLGATLYHLAAGRPPFEGNLLELIVAHATHPLPPPAAVRPGLSEGLSRLIQHLMAKRPEYRVQSAEELLGFLSNVRWGLPIPDCPNADEPYQMDGAGPRTGPYPPRNFQRWLWIKVLLGIAALSLAAAGGALLWRIFGR